MNYTDGFIVLCFAFFFYSGWTKGFLRALLGPISLCIGTIISYVYYAQTNDLLIAVLIGILAPILLRFGLGILLSLLQSGKKEDEKLSSFSTISRTLGGLFQLTWQGTILLLFLFLIYLITMIPGNIAFLENIQSNIQASKTFEILASWANYDIPEEKVDLHTLSQVVNNPEMVKEVRDTASYKKLVENTDIQELFQDDEIVNYIKDKNYLALMKEKRIQKMMEDEEFLENIFALQKEILKSLSKNTKTIK